MTNVEREIEWFKQRFKNIDGIYRGEKNGSVTTTVKLKPYLDPYTRIQIYAKGSAKASISDDNVELGILWAYQKAIEDAVYKTGLMS